MIRAAVIAGIGTLRGGGSRVTTHRAAPRRRSGPHRAKPWVAREQRETQTCHVSSRSTLRRFDGGLEFPGDHHHKTTQVIVGAETHVFSALSARSRTGVEVGAQRLHDRRPRHRDRRRVAAEAKLAVTTARVTGGPRADGEEDRAGVARLIVLAREQDAASRMTRPWPAHLPARAVQPIQPQNAFASRSRSPRSAQDPRSRDPRANPDAPVRSLRAILARCC